MYLNPKLLCAFLSIKVNFLYAGKDMALLCAQYVLSLTTAAVALAPASGNAASGR